MYDVNHDGIHKAILVSGGYLTYITDESFYSGVVYLHGIQILVFILNINETVTWATYTENTYLEEKTLHKVDIIAGIEFGDKKGQILIFDKVLYGIQYYGLIWHEGFDDCIRYMGFFMCKLEPDMCMRQSGDIWIYF